MGKTKLMLLVGGYICPNVSCNGRMHVLSVAHDVTPECEPRVEVVFCCNKCGEQREIDIDDISGDMISSIDVHPAWDPKRGKLGRSPQR